MADINLRFSAGVIPTDYIVGVASSYDMEFYEVLESRRSIRSFQPREVSEEALERIVNAARMAPSGSNRQPGRFYVVSRRELVERLAEACGGQSWIAQAPVVVVATGRRIGYNRGGYMGDMSFIMDVSIAFTHLVLAARAEGLGTCWIGDFDNGAVKRLLGIGDGEDVVAVTPLGYPAGRGFTREARRKALEEVVVWVE